MGRRISRRRFAARTVAGGLALGYGLPTRSARAADFVFKCGTNVPESFPSTCTPQEPLRRSGRRRTAASTCGCFQITSSAATATCSPGSEREPGVLLAFRRECAVDVDTVGFHLW
jgi:hypothetical protein